ncbi:MAG: radical SAM protein [Caldimicrobium sp.]|nr:radical SAM protein [Caldimicrobium sp.]MCX7612811.1 radical SAM protein [Caldimicrobium sp.]MDW8182915.1 radical SAM protein [Caldimicrobium sp.]
MALKKCSLCSKPKIVAKILGVCRECILERFTEALPYIDRAHKLTRESFSLPSSSLTEGGGARCNLCARKCLIPEGCSGYCGLRKNTEGVIKGPHHKEAFVSWYLDPLPTNCVADWFCPGGTGCGYPQFSYKNGPEQGFYNLAVFFEGCNLNCLYCQNWHFRYSHLRSKKSSLKELLMSLNQKVACVCYFGGDPSPQAPFAIKLSKLAIEKRMDSILRICWETNGLFSQALLPQIIELSLITGGIIKIDLKAWHKEIHLALTGFGNEKILQNFVFVAQFISKRESVPLLTASTLLVPGYVEEEEVYNIAKFIAELNPEIPYRLLAFSPQFYMSDLPLLEKKKANEVLKLAKAAGLKIVSLGNEHLLR